MVVVSVDCAKAMEDVVSTAVQDSATVQNNIVLDVDEYDIPFIIVFSTKEGDVKG